MRDDQQKLITSFMEIAFGQTIDTARQFLTATSWNLEEAINLFLIHRQNQPLCKQNATEQYWSDYQEEEDIPPPLPSVRDTLYDDYYSSIYQTPVQVCPEEIWDAESETSDSDGSAGPPDSKPELSEESRKLSSLYRPPQKLLFQGTFEEAKSKSCEQNLWLLVNLQSTTEFASHTLNRDVWANEVVSQAIESSFILSQVYDDTTQGQKVSTFYRIESCPPVVLLIDPVTGQMIRSWSGVIEAHGFVEDLMKYMDHGPHEYMPSPTRNKRMKKEDETCCSSTRNKRMRKEDETCCSSTRNKRMRKEDETCCSSTRNKRMKEEDETCRSSNQTIDNIDVPSWGSEFEKSAEVKQDETCLRYPDLTEEPEGDCDKSVVCSLCVRFPDGRRKQRKFLKSEPVQLLWSFCYSQMVESEKKAFKLVQAIPGASKTLEYGANATFDQSGLANSMISVAWE